MTFQGETRIANFKGKKHKKKPRKGNDAEYLKRLRNLPCCVCGNPPPNTVHHLKATGERGGALRSPDRYGVPMCMFPHGKNCHGTIEGIGSKNELKWFKDRGIDALSLASSLWDSRGRD